jgi:hypothetical protein
LEIDPVADRFFLTNKKRRPKPGAEFPMGSLCGPMLPALRGQGNRPQRPAKASQSRSATVMKTTHSVTTKAAQPQTTVAAKHVFAILPGMDRADATTPEIGTAHQVVGHFSLLVNSSSVDLKRFLRLVIFLGTIALSIFLGYKVTGLISSAVKEAGTQMHWLNIVGF